MADLLNFNPNRALDLNADGAAGAQAFFYNAGTLVARTVYSDVAGVTPHASPVVADANGVFPAVFAIGGTPVKVIIKDSDGVTLHTLDPVVKIPASQAAASGISFSPTEGLPFTDVQAAIEGAVQAANEGFGAFGIGVTGNATELAAIDATDTGSGAYRYTTDSTGTFPSGVTKADGGVILVWRENASDAVMILYPVTAGGVYTRKLEAGTWGSWLNSAPIDDDTFAAATDDRPPSAESTKAYVDAQVATAGWTFATPEAGSGETELDFTSIPAGVNEIAVTGELVSLSGTDHVLVQLGDSGGFETTGYQSAGFLAGNNTTGAITDGMAVYSGNASTITTWTMRLLRTAGNKWIQDHSGRTSLTFPLVGGGSKELSAELTQVRVTRTGTNTFDGDTSFTVGWRT